MNGKTRNIGWLIAAGLLGAALIAPSAAFANIGHQSGDSIAWNDQEFQGSSEECDELKLGPGEVFWHFIQNQVPDGIASGKLSGTVTEGPFGPVDSYKKSGGTLHWGVTTGHTTLLTFSSDVQSDGNLNLSHICTGPEEESDEPSDEVKSDEPSDEVKSDEPSDEVKSESPSGSVDSESDEPSAEVQSDEPSDEVQSDEPSDEVKSDEPSDEVKSESPSGSVESESDDPSGSVEEVTGTPEEENTPPQTDALGNSSAPTTGGWQLILVALAAVLATALIITPSSRKTRR